MASAHLEAKTEQLKSWKHPSKKHLHSTSAIPIKEFASSDEVGAYKEKQLILRAGQAKEQSANVGEEIRKHPTAKPVRGKHGHKKSRVWDDRDQEKEKITEERHLKLAEDFDNVRKHYRKLYVKALNEKIKLQNVQIQECSRRMEEKLHLEEEKRHHQVKIKRPKSQNINDFDFLNNVEETNYYKIIRIEEQLRRKGLLSKPYSKDCFWSYVMKPNHLNDVLEKGEFGIEDIQNMYREEEQDVEEKEEETSRSWALTDVQKSSKSNKSVGRTEKWVKVSLIKHGVCTPSPMAKVLEAQPEEKPPPKDQKTMPRKGSKALTIEQKFPKVDFPPLAAYSLVFGEQEIDPEVIREQEMEEKRKQFRDDLVNCHNSMFLHALANKAATQRLMARNKDYNFDQLAEGPTIHDLLGNCLESSFVSKKALKPIEAVPVLTFKKVKKPSKQKRRRRQDFIDMASASEPELSEETHRTDSQGPSPLTLDGILDKCTVKEAKGLSTLWVNPSQ